jgi:hypothetical protein
MVCMRRSSKKLPKDSNQLAAEIVRLSTEEPKQSVREYLAAIGRKGGLKGGNVRANRLSREKRSEIASKAAKVRWAKRQDV